ncbi:hypothetical protein HDV05_003966 [Chytridiales sp. JEL 0842]|nr:hypothetical protein HDV05_003966 [Chytridiales sp. JEL 0842]
MGNILLKAFGGKASSSKRELRIVMMGLDGSGKTSILYRLKKAAVMETVPTVGFNVEAVKFKNISFQVWDCGGQDSIRPLWRHYFAGTQGLVFVIDSADEGRMKEASRELGKILENPEMEGVPVLVLANKQDLEEVLTVDEITSMLDLKSRATDRQWQVAPACGTTGQGLTEALSWLGKAIPDKELKSTGGTMNRSMSRRRN